MRLILISSLAALLSGIFLMTLIESEPGYILIAFGRYTIESSVWFASVALVFLLIFFYLMLRILRKLILSHDNLKVWLEFRGSKRSAELMNNGIINWIEGNWEKSRDFFLKSAKHSEAPLLNYLMAARASHKLAENEQVFEYLQAAEKSDGNAGVAIELTQAEMRLEVEQYEQALATLVRARRNAERHPYVLELLCKAYLGVKDWNSLLKLVEEVKKYKIFSPKKLNDLERSIYKGFLQLRLDGNNPIKELNSRWGKIPVNIRSEIPIIRQYIILLIKNSAYAHAEDLLLSTLRKDWDVSLLRLLSFIEGGDLGRRFKILKVWLREKENDGDLLFCLGKLATNLERFDEAREFFIKSLSINPSLDVFMELGNLSALLGELEESVDYFTKGAKIGEKINRGLTLL